MSSRKPGAPPRTENHTGARQSGEAPTPESIRRAIVDNLHHMQGRIPRNATPNDWYMAVAYTVRDRILRRWMQSIEAARGGRRKLVSYFSAEFLIGPQLGSNLVSLGVYDQVREAVEQLGLNLDEVLGQEEEPGLGNGGLGRLAACFLDSLATLEIPAVGYGIRYEFGIFDQLIRDGWQVETTDKWLRLGNPWEIVRPEIAYTVNFGGHTEQHADREGGFAVVWRPQRSVKGVACDYTVPGYRVGTVNLLRLWKAEAAESFDLQAFNEGDYYGAVEEKVSSENITKILYPNDDRIHGKRLRLEQQYFFVSCSLRDLIRIHLGRGGDLRAFHESNAIQLNDTHPAIAVAELMRLFVDEHGLDWDTAWRVTRATFAYTNHTLLPEALERWPLPLFAALLPRHLEIIFEINRRFIDEVRASGAADDPLIARLSLIDETGEKFVRMANLASVGSHAINGVAALHSELLMRDVLRDFHAVFPEKFFNVTNGVTPRRWVVLSNPRLARLISSRIGDAWIHAMEEQLPQLERHADDEEFRAQWRQIKLENKNRLAAVVRQRLGIVVDPGSLFDIQVKRIHEYKRQHLNILHVVALFNRIKRDPGAEVTPRTVIFGGKAAPGYFMAKLIIKLITSVAAVVNGDPDVRGRLKVVFYPDFNVKHAHAVYPAADLSEQISTAGKEASGTGNMKFAMNGALTIGTLDGANVEIRAAVGEENFFLFGLSADEVRRLHADGYDPRAWLESSPELRGAVDALEEGRFSNGDRGLFRPLLDSLLLRDHYLLFADFLSYLQCQRRAEEAYRDPDRWARMSILNVARVGTFSSDRSIRDYARKIWGLTPPDGAKR